MNWHRFTARLRRAHDEPQCESLSGAGGGDLFAPRLRAQGAQFKAHRPPMTDAPPVPREEEATVPTRLDMG